MASIMARRQRSTAFRHRDGNRISTYLQSRCAKYNLIRNAVSIAGVTINISNGNWKSALQKHQQTDIGQILKRLDLFLATSKTQCSVISLLKVNE